MAGLVIGDYDFTLISDVHSLALKARPAKSNCGCATPLPSHPNGPLLYHGKPTREYLEQLAASTAKFSPCAARCNATAKSLKEAAACRVDCIMKNHTTPSEQQDPAGPCIDACARACKGDMVCLEACAVQCVAETHDQRYTHCPDDAADYALW